MKTTITINLGGIVFHIDDDAYDKLNSYLEQEYKQLAQMLHTTPATGDLLPALFKYPVLNVTQWGQ